VKKEKDYIRIYSHVNKTPGELKSVYNSIDKLISIIDSLDLPKDIENKRILVKPNWVLDPKSSDDEYCLITHPNIILALITLLAKRSPAKIIIGDAPIQGCNISAILSNEFKSKVASISKENDVPIVLNDFRRVVLDQQNRTLIKQNSDDMYIYFDVGSFSYLEPITNDKTQFRVTDYSHKRLAESHRPGKHVYCITKELFESDIIISIPKMKTHQKTGLTNALKILVGVNGDKDYLPHHRVGGTDIGGDAYPGKNVARRISEFVFDFGNRYVGSWPYFLLKPIAKIIWKLSNPNQYQHYSAAWYGNDTTWRMVLDLNRVAIYGRADGSISEIRQREVFSLSDGIIGGQGDGPLRPEPLYSGILAFSNNNRAIDQAVAMLMGLNMQYLQLLNEASMFDDIQNCEVIVNGSHIEKITELIDYKVAAKPAPGWIGKLDTSDSQFKD
jgi:uncharacterized protein (DUF362 family)